MNVRIKTQRDGTHAWPGEGMGARRQSKSKDQFGPGLHKQFAKPCISKPHGQLCHFWIATAEEGKRKKSY